MDFSQSNGSSFSVIGRNTSRDIIVYSLLVVLALLIIAINSFVIIIVYHKEFLQTVTNFCLVSLACSDLLSGVFVIPLIIGCSLSGVLKVCVAMDCSQRFLATSTICHLLMITIERYYTIVFSTTYSGSAVSRTLCRVSLVIIWTISLCVSLIQLSWIKLHPSPEELKIIAKIEVTYVAVTLALVVLLPLAIMIFCNAHILWTVKRHVKNISRDVGHVSTQSELRHKRKERNALFIFVTMIVVFVIGWFNYFFSALQTDLGYRDGFPFWADTFLLFLRFSTGLFNPILYTFLKQDFRRVSRSMLQSVSNCFNEKNPESNRKIFDVSVIRSNRGCFTPRHCMEKYEVNDSNTQLITLSTKDFSCSNVFPKTLVINNGRNSVELNKLPSHYENPQTKQCDTS